MFKNLLKNAFGDSVNAFFYKDFTPLDIADLVAWYDGSDLSALTYNGAGLISQADDKSGNGNHAVQNTGDDRPETGVRTVNGLNVITGRNGDKHFTITNTPNMLYVFAVVNIISTDALNLLTLPRCVDDANYEFFIRSNATDDISFDEGGTGTGSYAIDGGAFSVFAENHTSPSAPQSGAIILYGGFDSTQQAASILARPFTNLDNDGHDLCELFFTLSKPSNDIIEQITNYFRSKWL